MKHTDSKVEKLAESIYNCLVRQGQWITDSTRSRIFDGLDKEAPFMRDRYYSLANDILKRESVTVESTPRWNMKILYPYLNGGINVSIRKGDRWYKQASVGDKLRIYNTGEECGEPFATAEIIGTAYIPFLTIPDEWLHLNHDSRARCSWDSLNMMRVYYGNFDPSETVSVIIFKVVKYN